MAGEGRALLGSMSERVRTAGLQPTCCNLEAPIPSLDRLCRSPVCRSSWPWACLTSGHGTVAAASLGGCTHTHTDQAHERFLMGRLQEGPRQRVVMKQNRNVGELPPSDSESESEEEAGTRRLLSATLPLNTSLSRRGEGSPARGERVLCVSEYVCV